MQMIVSRYFWYFYIALLLVLGIGRSVFSFLHSDTMQISMLYPPLSAAVISVGIYGFVTQQGILQSFLWKVVFWLCTLMSATLTALFIYLLSSYQENSLTVSFIGFGIALLLPSQYALFNYIYTNDALWNNTHN